MANVNSYMRVCLGRSRKCQRLVSLHRIIATAFLPNLKELRTVNHKNGIKTDNRIGNLEWSSYSDNLKHAVAMGLNPPRKGEHAHGAKLVESQVREIKKLCKDKAMSQSKIAKKYGVSRSAILNIHLGNAWKHLQY